MSTAQGGLAEYLEQLAVEVRNNPPYAVEVDDQNAVRDVTPDVSGKYHYRVRESGGRLETTIRIRWQP